MTVADIRPRRRSAPLIDACWSSCFLGTTIEWYDFLVYGFLAPLAFNRLFFPSLSPLAGTIAAFGVFAVGFAARPLGGVFFAHFGDRIGRKPIMVSTLILMGASTTLIGLTPTFAQIGIAAPIILVCLRFLQGFSLGGESAAGPLLAMESAPGNTRGFFAALVSSGAAAGTVLGALAAFAVGTLPREQLLSWGWRLPFLASALDLRDQLLRAHEGRGVAGLPAGDRARGPRARAAARGAAALQGGDAAGAVLRHGRVVDVLLHVGVRPVVRHPDAGAGQRPAALGRGDRQRRRHRHQPGLRRAVGSHRPPAAARRVVPARGALRPAFCSFRCCAPASRRS